MTLGSVYFDTRVLFGILMIILVFGCLIVFLQLKKSKINRKIKRCSDEVVGIVEAVSESKIENKIIKHNKEYIETEYEGNQQYLENDTYQSEYCQNSAQDNCCINQ